MSVRPLAPVLASPRWSTMRIVALAGSTLACSYLAVLASAWLGGWWLVDAQGQPIASDFVNVWAAGRLVLDGQPVAAYDWSIHKAMEVRAVGHEFAGYYGWHYPPPFLFVAALLATLPLLPASLVWLAATLPLYAAAIRSIVADRAGVALALGFPAVLWNATAGQNGFLTAALIGGTLALLERHPTLAGICLGLLSYKPHFGLLFPLALVASRHWHTMIVAAGVAAGMVALPWLAFGDDIWRAFFAWMPTTTRYVLVEGAADWDRLQSLFGFVRARGGSEVLAWTVYVAAALMLAAAIWRLWRSRAAFELKAAALATGTLLATPYLYIYDLVVLAVAVAFLVRHGLARGFHVAEAIGLPIAGVLLLIYPYAKSQTGLAAALIVLALIGWRAINPAVSARAV